MSYWRRHLSGSVPQAGRAEPKTDLAELVRGLEEKIAARDCFLVQLGARVKGLEGRVFELKMKVAGMSLWAKIRALVGF
jgi:hypothetical protein